MKMMTGKIVKVSLLMSLFLALALPALAQGLKAKGTVVDSSGEPVIGASVVLKSNKTVGTITDFDGNFELNVPSEKSVLVVSFVGMNTKEVPVSKGVMKIVLTDDQKQLEEVVVVGYGQQKKASVVGAIAQTTGKVLERSAGITDVGAALTGNLPGVVTTQGSGMPGEEEPDIVIRGASSWNNSAPLVLVDGIERPMNSVEMQSVASISVLKDASATAVYGVKGANGVILITTKRGSEGKPQISVSANAIMKMPSMLPDKMDSYDAFVARNTAIEHELNLSPDSWSKVLPMSFIQNYRNQTTVEQQERYPNVDWQRALFKDYTMSYNANLNVSGGTRFVKYFAAVDFVSEGDLYRHFNGGRTYDAKTGYGYHRVNVRSNLDFNITKSTILKVNIAGSNAVRQTPGVQSFAGDYSDWQISQQWAGVYNISPDCFLPQYSDGSWGFLPGSTNVSNSAVNIATGGVAYNTTTSITTDFVLEQKLDFITKGLNARGMISWDNRFREGQRGISDMYNPIQYKWVDPATGEINYKEVYEQYDRFDYTIGNKWQTSNGSVQDWSTQRNLNYQLQLNWARQFGKHSVSAMGLWGRQEYATGSMIPAVREDWVFRATYDFNSRYFLEYNGAYNGSEKFSKDNRFAFFSSGAIGWMISEEPFMKWLRDKKIIDMLKLRASYGEIGDDNVGGRFLYQSQWAYGGQSCLDVTQGTSPYVWYRESQIGNPDVHWETVKKTNFGLDYSLFDGLLAGSVELFHDNRVDILVNGGSRALPSYYGANAATINKGQVKTKGYEIELRFNKTLANNMHLWANLSMTHAENKVIVKDDAELLPNYQKAAGYAIGQPISYINKGMMQTYDDIYGSPKHDSNDGYKLPGDYYIIDFNGDGVVTNDDRAPYGYTGTPQNTYNATLGLDWKGFNIFAQFYGVTNVLRDVTMISFSDVMLANVYNQGTWWSNDHNGAEVLTPRFNAKPGNDARLYGTQYLCDGSFIRLKNIEIGYTWNGGWVKKLGLNNLKIFVSGNNLWLWTRMPDDRETNNQNLGGSTAQGAVGAYPTMKRINFGIKFNL